MTRNMSSVEVTLITAELKDMGIASVIMFFAIFDVPLDGREPSVSLPSSFSESTRIIINTALANEPNVTPSTPPQASIITSVIPRFIIMNMITSPKSLKAASIT